MQKNLKKSFLIRLTGGWVPPAGGLISKNLPSRGLILTLVSFGLFFTESFYHNQGKGKGKGQGKIILMCFLALALIPCPVISLFRMKNIHDLIWASALRKLEVRPHSTAEMIRKLEEKFPEDRGIILKVIEEMERVNLLNDRQFTEEFVHHLIQKPIGRIKIMVETRKKGLDQDLVDQMLENENWSEEESAKKALDEKERTLGEADKRKRKQKLVNFLRNRGFKDSVIYKALK